MNIFDVFTPKSDTFFLMENMTLRQALEKFDKHKFSVVPVIAVNGEYITTISQGDILRYIKQQGNYDMLQLEKVGIMSIERYRPYVACSHSHDVSEILRIGLQQNFIPIVDDYNVYIGIVKRKSIIEVLFKRFDDYKHLVQ